MESTKTRLLPRLNNCGQTTSSRIYGGNFTKIDEYPWMALIEYIKRKKCRKLGIFFCNENNFNFYLIIFVIIFAPASHLNH